MDSDVDEPINLGSSEMVTINELVDIVEDIAGLSLVRRYDVFAPKGVRGRNSDNTMICERLGWEPRISLRNGLEQTYEWVYEQVAAATGLTSLSRQRVERLLKTGGKSLRRKVAFGKATRGGASLR
jgi:dTDP-D-glucose 4,6-dehydratase